MADEDSLVQLAPGDALVMFTDGITEAAKADDEEFGEDRLVDAAQSRNGLSASELQVRVFADVKAFCDSQFREDSTLIVLTTGAAVNEPR